MTVPFTRQLGYEPGVQLNPLQDQTDGIRPDLTDQVFAMPARLVRGRIDKPFRINKGNFTRLVGRGETIRKTRLNEAMSQLFVGVRYGAYEAVVYRLHTSEAKLQYIIVTETTDRTGFNFSLADTLPETPFFLAIKHLECFNDGIKVRLHAEKLYDAENNLVDNPFIELTLLDGEDNKLFATFKGSLDIEHKDDFGQSSYLPDIVERQSLLDSLSGSVVEVVVGAGTAISKNSAAYGLNVNNYEKAITSPLLNYFTEGSLAYTQEDYAKARQALRDTHYDFGYLSVGGNQAIGLINEIIGLAYDINTQFRVDIDGTLGASAAIAFKNQFNIDKDSSDLVHWYWKPIKNDDPLGVSPPYHMGGATLNIALSCKRNGNTKDYNGFANKIQPIAGSGFPLPLTGMVQTASPSSNDLSELAKNRINPILYERYSGSGSYVFTDSLTSHPSDVSYRKLISVAERSADMGYNVSRYAKECEQLPMSEAIDRMEKFLQTFFENAETAKWIIPSNDLDGKSFAFEVRPITTGQADQLGIRYSLSFDGTVRQFYITPTLVKPSYNNQEVAL